MGKYLKNKTSLVLEKGETIEVNLLFFKLVSTHLNRLEDALCPSSVLSHLKSMHHNS